MRHVLTFRSALFVLVVLALSAAVAASVAPAGPAFADRTAGESAAGAAGISSAGTTGLAILNLDPAQPAMVVLDFYKQVGGAPVSLTMPAIAPGGIGSFYLPARAELMNGAYASVVSADRHIAVLARTEWPTSGGATVYHSSRASTAVLVPLVVKDYLGQTSLVTIQNTDRNARTTVELVLFRHDDSSPVQTVQYPIEPGTSITLDLGRSRDFAAIPAGFIGAARVTSAMAVAVQSFVDIESSQQGVYAFEGIPVEAAADVLYAPMIHSRRLVDPAALGSKTRTTMIAVTTLGIRWWT